MLVAFATVLVAVSSPAEKCVNNSTKEKSAQSIENLAQEAKRRKPVLLDLLRSA